MHDDLSFSNVFIVSLKCFMVVYYCLALNRNVFLNVAAVACVARLYYRIDSPYRGRRGLGGRGSTRRGAWEGVESVG